MSDGSTSADVLLEWERMGIPITHDQENEIRASGLAEVLSRQRDQDRQLADLTIKDVKTGRHHLWLYPEQAEESGEGTQSYYDRIPQEWKDKWKGKIITKADWYRPPPTREGKGKKVDKEFRDFINSHIPDFSKLIPYEPFYCYIEQDRRFRVTETAELDNLRGDERKAFVREEYRRIDKDEGANRLYGMNRYIWIKDELSEAGIRDYLASTPQALALYCADCDWNIYLGKGRQAALTSTFVPAQLLLNLLKPSSKVVLVTDELETKAKEIFEDKFKFSFQWLPKWWKPKGKGTFSTRAVVFDFDPGVDKTERKKYSSGFAVSASHDPTVVNGLTPTVLLLDEAQGIPTFDKLVMEAKPTGFSLQKGKLKKGQRQVIAWGTGSSSNKGKGAFEGAYTGLVNAWRKGEDTQGTLPLFFDALCRPGMTDEILQDIYQEYMLGKHKDAKGMTRDEAEAGYYAHYPRNPDDMFITTGRSVVPMDMIRGAMSLIDDYLVGTENMVKYGYFRPIYDESRAMPREMALPFYIKGVEFVETPHDPDAFVQMFLPPVKGWKWRYFQGTDPIQSDGGTSKFASAIWDNVGIRKGGCHKTAEPHTHPTVACILNGRTNNVDEIYLQSALMGMYYANHGERSCKELVEWNQGHLYIKDFKQRMYIDQEKSLVRRLELPITYLHGRQQQDYGVDMKSGRRSAAYRDLTTLLHTMKDDGRNIWFHDFWTQLKTIEVETKSDDSVVWGTMDYKKFNDDLVDAVFFSELCARCYSKTPIQVEHDTPKTVPVGMWDRSGGYPKWIVRHVPNEHQPRPRPVPEKVLTVRS